MKKNIILTFVMFSMALFMIGSVSGQCPVGRYKSEKRLDNTIKLTLPVGSRFYIRMEKALSSQTYREGDIIKFTVLEDVYGNFQTEKLPDSGLSEKLREYLKGITLAEDDAVVIIPKDSVGYGRVNYSQHRSSFYLKGKSKIFVRPEYVMLADGGCIPVEIPNDYEEYNEQGLYKNVVPCKHQPEDRDQPNTEFLSKKLEKSRK